MLKLPLRVQQEIKSYTQFALPLCVVFTEKNYHPWILKNFMEIKSAKTVSKNGNHFQYAINNIDGNDLTKIDYDAVLDVNENSWSEIPNHVDFIRQQLTSGRYVHHQLDEFYIKNKTAYQKVNFLHPSLIYGFCDHNKEFYAVGFTALNFKEFTISYDEMTLATNASEQKNMEMTKNSHKNRTSYSYQLKPSFGKYAFSLIDLKENLNNYLSAPEIDGWIYGLGGYELVLKNLIDPYVPGNYLKYNTTHFLWEHKRMFNLALNYIFFQHQLQNKFNDLQADHKKIVGLVERVRLMHMEAVLVEQQGGVITRADHAQKFYTCIKEIYDMERAVLESIQKKLSLCV